MAASIQSQSVLLSRTDAIGDVVLTLPMAVWLRKRFPQMRIGFLGRAYTRAVAEACPAVDAFVEKADFLATRPGELAARWDAIVHVFPDRCVAGHARDIRYRIGTTNRLWHWWMCNKLVPLSRKRSNLHEAQLNSLLLRPLGLDKLPFLEELGALPYLYPHVPVPQFVADYLQHRRRVVVLHAKSAGSAREWAIGNFVQLAEALRQRRYGVIITGTAQERAALQPLLDAGAGWALDLVGKVSLEELIAVLAACDVTVAGSTGPLHLAAAAGSGVIGLYPAERPMHVGRWGPLGPKAGWAIALPVKHLHTRAEQTQSLHIPVGDVLDSIMSAANA